MRTNKGFFLDPNRLALYTIGIVLLALGLALAAETQLGTSPLTAIPFVISECCGIPFAETTFLWFLCYIAGQLASYCRVRPLLPVLLQIPLSTILTSVMNITQKYIEISNVQPSTRFGLLLISVVLIGIGAAMSLDADMIPTPGDGFVMALVTRTGKPLGYVKNAVDISCVGIASLLSLLLCGTLKGVGIGSVVSMLCVGRIINIYGIVRRKFSLTSDTIVR